MKLQQTLRYCTCTVTLFVCFISFYQFAFEPLHKWQKERVAESLELGRSGRVGHKGRVCSSRWLAEEKQPQLQQNHQSNATLKIWVHTITSYWSPSVRRRRLLVSDSARNDVALKVATFTDPCCLQICQGGISAKQQETRLNNVDFFFSFLMNQSMS